MSKSNKIIRSWEKNTAEWIKVIDTNLIPSREFTNRAIVQTIANLGASKILDVGCGEGWLTREITGMGKTAVGIDAIPGLLENARKKGTESYYTMSYEEIIEGTSIPEAPFDTAVFNFSLYQKNGLKDLLIQTKKALSANGTILIQTLHPFFLLQQGLEYKSQWMHDSWRGLPGNFTDGHSWYARTFEDWTLVFKQSSLVLEYTKEIIGESLQPVSVIFTLTKV